MSSTLNGGDGVDGGESTHTELMLSEIGGPVGCSTIGSKVSANGDEMRTVDEALKDPSGQALPCINQLPGVEFFGDSRGMLEWSLLHILGVFLSDRMVGADDTLTCAFCIPLRVSHLGDDGDDGDDDISDEGEACSCTDVSKEWTRRIGIGCALLSSDLGLEVHDW